MPFMRTIEYQMLILLKFEIIRILTQLMQWEHDSLKFIWDRLFPTSVQKNDLKHELNTQCKMKNWYGSTTNIYLTKDIMGKIISYLSPIEWPKLKLNTKILALMEILKTPMSVDEVSVHQYISSLGQNPIDFEVMCRYGGSLTLVKKFVSNKEIVYIGPICEQRKLYILSLDVSFDILNLVTTITGSSASQYTQDICRSAIRGACESGNAQIIDYILKLSLSTCNYLSLVRGIKDVINVKQPGFRESFVIPYFPSFAPEDLIITIYIFACCGAIRGCHMSIFEQMLGELLLVLPIKKHDQTFMDLMSFALRCTPNSHQIRICHILANIRSRCRTTEPSY